MIDGDWIEIIVDQVLAQAKTKGHRLTESQVLQLIAHNKIFHRFTTNMARAFSVDVLSRTMEELPNAS